jgi:[protein-PII] uridylyltransferase
VLSGKADVKELLRNRPKPALPSRKAGIAARVSLDSEASGTATLVEIVAEDRPGLLYDLATAISANGGKLNAEKQNAIREAVEKAAGVVAR